jgi:hypothetical protein
LYRHSTKETNEDTTSSCSDHQHTPDRKPEQSPSTKDGGTNSITTPEQESHTLGSNDLISTSSTEKASHQTTNLCLSPQTKNQQHPNQSQRVPPTTNPHNATHQSLSRNLHHLPHQSPVTHTMDYCHQTNIALASLLLCHRRDDEPLDLKRLNLLSRMP